MDWKANWLNDSLRMIEHTTAHWDPYADDTALLDLDGLLQLLPL